MHIDANVVGHSLPPPAAHMLLLKLIVYTHFWCVNSARSTVPVHALPQTNHLPLPVSSVRYQGLAVALSKDTMYSSFAFLDAATFLYDESPAS